MRAEVPPPEPEARRRREVSASRQAAGKGAAPRPWRRRERAASSSATWPRWWSACSASCPLKRCCAPPGKRRGVAGGRRAEVDAVSEVTWAGRAGAAVLQRVPAVEGVRAADPAHAAAPRLGVGTGTRPAWRTHAGAGLGPRARGGSACAEGALPSLLPPGSCLAERGGVGTGLALPARPRLASSCRGCTSCPRPCSTSPTRRRSAGTRSATSTRKVPAGRGADGAAGGGGTAAGRALSLNVEGNAARLAAEPRGSAAVYPVLLAGRGSCAGNSRGMRKEWLRALVLSGLQQLPSSSLRRFCFLFNSQKKKQ